MARSLTNNLSLRYAIESSVGTLPGTPLWVALEPNSIGGFGAAITTVPRNPISNTRQQRKGSVTDLESAVEWEGDLTKDHMLDFIEGFLFASRANTDEIPTIQAGSDYDTLAATGSDTFTHTALGAALPAGTLVFSRGFTNSENKGLFEVDTGSTTTVTELANTPGTVVEAPAVTTGATVEVCGFRLTDGTWDDTTKQIGSTLTDLSTLGLTVGQFLRVGSDENALTGGQLVGRITAITAAAITLDKVQNLGASTLNGGGNVTANDVDLLYGQFVRNVGVDDSDYLERFYQFELRYADLDSVGTDEYEYAIGNLCNELTINLPGQDKATLGFSFLGTNADDFTTTRKGNAANAVGSTKTTAFNTAAAFSRLNLLDTSENSLATCFKNATITIGNEGSLEKCLGTLGASFVNVGNFTLGIDAELLFTDSDVADAVKNNTTLTFDLLLRNDDGAFALDVPSLTLGDGSKSFPVNESINISVTATAFQDPTLATSLSYSDFPYFPAVA